jgi:hypothetical protein
VPLAQGVLTDSLYSDIIKVTLTDVETLYISIYIRKDLKFKENHSSEAKLAIRRSLHTPLEISASDEIIYIYLTATESQPSIWTLPWNISDKGMLTLRAYSIPVPSPRYRFLESNKSYSLFRPFPKLNP